jgi:ubiquinone/menaquinone biosynthesis C-methylase UbiE
MTDAHTHFRGSIPEFYHRCLGPFLFEPYADDLVGRLASGPGSRVLEIACGTGIVTRRLRAALPQGAELVATDLNPAMIERARRALAGADIHWRTADAGALPFKDATFDAVVCQFGFMFLPDRATGFAEARRVLRPGGTLLASSWASLEENPAAAIVHATASRLFESSPPRFLLVPYGSLDAETMRALALAAGFAEASVARVVIEGSSPSAREVATGFAMGTPLSLEILERGGDLEGAAAAFEKELAAHGGHPFRSPLAAHVLRAS